MMVLARAISFLLGPIFTFFPVPFVLVAKYTQDYSYALKWTLFTYTFILAVALFIVICVMLGIFSNFDVSKREQRPLLFSFTAFITFCYLLSLFIFQGPRILFIAVFTVVFGLIIFAIINRWIKASIHLATATGVIMFVGVAYEGYFFFLLPLLPLLAWSRIKMKKHSLTETIIGSISGIVITLIMYIVSKQFLFGLINN